MISIRDLSYLYPNSTEPALRAVNWQVHEGEWVLLAGPSGSGKSTLLRCLNGLVPHFSGGTITGQVMVGGLDAVAAGPHLLSRHAGFVSQSPEAQAVLDEVEAEIAFALENSAVAPQEMRVRVEEVLDMLDLAPLRHRSLATLSGGERQRVAIAAALALRPDVLILDEPTSQLDPQSADDVLRSLIRLNEDLGLTIILAEHRLERVLHYIDRLTYLENGQITADGPAREVVATIPDVPPLLDLARRLNWRPLPVTVKEGRRFAASYEPVADHGKRIDADGHPTSAAQNSADFSSVEKPLLAAERLRFAYNGHPALKDVDVRVHAGEAVAVMGRNGSGKTTLLKCVVGLLAQQSGEVWVNGRSTNGRSVADISREVAYLPQNPDDLLFAESVADELALTLRNHGIRRARPALDALLDTLGLAAVAGAYPRDLSVGQRQRVALGAVTVTQPRLLLLDEPTRGLDLAAKKALVAIWCQWLRAGAGLVLVTHDVELAAMIADRAIIMSQGEIIASGETAEVLTTSPHFAPQIARLFPGRGWLTVDDALAGLGVASR
jgi:energy-coupling factor transport system ATP-binding protein